MQNIPIVDSQAKIEQDSLNEAHQLYHQELNEARQLYRQEADERIHCQNQYYYLEKRQEELQDEKLRLNDLLKDILKDLMLASNCAENPRTIRFLGKALGRIEFNFTKTKESNNNV